MKGGGSEMPAKRKMRRKEERTNQKRTKNQEVKEVDEQNMTNYCRVEKWPFNEAHDSFAFAGKEFQKEKPT